MIGLAVLTEAMVTQLLKRGSNKIEIEKDTIITPSAQERLHQKGVEVIYLGENRTVKEVEKEKEETITSIPQLPLEYPYVCHMTEALFKEKPEYMTTIMKNRLVYKNHPRIIFRGQIDLFLAEMFKIMAKPNVINNSLVLNDLISIKDFLKKLQLSEVTEIYLEEDSLIGLTLKELREHSHNPKQYYKTEHLFNLDHTAPELVLDLNYLRAKARELEIKGFEAYFECGKVKREDILKGLNRLSSALYVMELKAVSSVYKL